MTNCMAVALKNQTEIRKNQASQPTSHPSPPTMAYTSTAFALMHAHDSGLAGPDESPHFRLSKTIIAPVPRSCDQAKRALERWETQKPHPEHQTETHTYEKKETIYDIVAAMREKRRRGREERQRQKQKREAEKQKAKDAHTNAYMAKLHEKAKETQEKAHAARVAYYADLLAKAEKKKEAEEQKAKDAHTNAYIALLIKKAAESQEKAFAERMAYYADLLAKAEKKKEERAEAERVKAMYADLTEWAGERKRNGESEQAQRGPGEERILEQGLRRVPHDSRIPAGFVFGSEMVLTKLEDSVVAVRSLGVNCRERKGRK